jgi:hypothetical protein
VNWLDPAREVLDRATVPIPFFLRDDDAGWHDPRLFALLQLAADRSLPLDLAVIPAETRPKLAHALLDHIAHSPGSLGLHQHGLAHVNHERGGRKCEFGPVRGRRAQLRDIATGRELLAALLGPHVDPIFTPPWNRCTRDTAECLVELGFHALSRESRAEPFGVHGLEELPVAVDWFAQRRGVRLGPAELGELIARATDEPGPVGIMFHHAVMDESELARATELLDLLASHDNAVVRPMRSLLRSAMPAR